MDGQDAAESIKLVYEVIMAKNPLLGGVSPLDAGVYNGVKVHRKGFSRLSRWVKRYKSWKARIAYSWYTR